MQELNLPDDLCNSDPDYNFFTCVQKNTTEKVPDNIQQIYCLIILSPRLGVELSGITGVIQVCPFVVLDNSTG